MKKVIAHYRKSIKPGKKSKDESVDYQRWIVEEYAKNNKLEVIKEFIDIDVSGTLTERPEFDELLYYVTEIDKTIDQVLFYSIDRLGRDTLVNIDLITELIEAIGKAMFVREGISTLSDKFKMLFLIFSSMAQQERENLLGKLAEGRRSKILTTKKFDGNYAPLGLNKQGQRLVKAIDDVSYSEIEKQEVDIVEFIFSSYLYGRKTLRQIAKDLNRQYGFTKRYKKWNYKSVKYILQNDAYIGVLSGVLEKSEYYYVADAEIERIIDPIIFVLVQQKLKYETTGRKKKEAVDLPTIILCRFCRNILERKGNYILCHLCNVTIKIDDVKMTIEKELKGYVSQDRTEDFLLNIKSQIIYQYQIKKWRIEEYIQKLLIRKDEIKKLEVIDNVKKRMLCDNTKAMVNLYYEMRFVQAILFYFQSVSSELSFFSWKESLYKYVIQLPFLTLIDLVDQRVDFLFLRAPLLK